MFLNRPEDKTYLPLANSFVSLWATWPCPCLPLKNPSPSTPRKRCLLTGIGAATGWGLLLSSLAFCSALVPYVGGGSLRSPPAPAGPPQRPGRGRGGAAAGPGPHLAAAWPDRAGAAPGAESVAGSRRQERAAGGEDAPGAGKQEEGQGQGHLQAGGQRGGGPRSRPTGSRGSPGRDGERVAAAVPRAAGARQPHGPRGGLRQCPRALRQGGRGFRHRPRRGTARGGVGAGPRPHRLRPPGAQPGAGAGVRLSGWLWPRGCWPASEQSDGAGRVKGCPGVKPGPFVGSPLSGVVEEAVPDS